MVADDEYAHLALETELLQSYWRDALDWVRAQVGDGRFELIADLGAGNGVGAVGLAQRFDGAQVLAVDRSAQLLDQVRHRAREAGLAARVQTVLADLDDGWPGELAELDLTWASMSLHHGADPERVLRDARAATRPGGFLAVAELTPGHEDGPAGPAVHEHHHDTLPTRGSAWAPRLRAAGWEVLAERGFVLPLDARPGGHPAVPKQPGRTVILARPRCG